LVKKSRRNRRVSETIKKGLKRVLLELQDVFKCNWCGRTWLNRLYCPDCQFIERMPLCASCRSVSISEIMLENGVMVQCLDCGFIGGHEYD